MATHITTLPPAPQRSDDALTFTTKADALLGALDEFVSDTNTVADEVEASANSASTDADTATAQALIATSAASQAAASANAVVWVSGTTYNANTVQISQIDFQSYRRTNTGSGTVDPKNDTTNYVFIGDSRTGAASPTGNVTLTNTSPTAQSFSPTGYGTIVKLPDATTVSRVRMAVFSLTNKSGYPIRIQNNAGTLLGFIPPFAGVYVDLVDSSTVAGVWSLSGADSIGVSGVLRNGSTNHIPQHVVEVSATLSVLMWINSGSLFAAAFDKSTGTFGASTLIRASTSQFHATLCSTGRIIVACANASTAFAALTISISGTTLTPNTAATSTLSATCNGFTAMISLGSNYTVAYSTSGGARLLCFTESAGTVTIGAETAIPTSATATFGMYAVNSTTGLVIATNATTTAFFQPFTVSGTTPSFGTAATRTITTGSKMYSRPLGSRYVAVSGNGECSLISVSGTAATGSNFTITTSGQGNIDSAGNLILNQISSTKMLILNGISNATTFSSYILTDSSGTASISSVLSITLPNVLTGSQYSNLVKISSTEALLFSYSLNNGSVSQNEYYSVLLDVSGATPTLKSISEFSMAPSTGSQSLAILQNPNITDNANGIFLGRQYMYYIPNYTIGMSTSCGYQVGGMLSVRGVSDISTENIRSMLYKNRGVVNVGASEESRNISYLASQSTVFAVECAP